MVKIILQQDQQLWEGQVEENQQQLTLDDAAFLVADLFPMKIHSQAKVVQSRKNTLTFSPMMHF